MEGKSAMPDVRRCVSLPAARTAETWKLARWEMAKGARRAARTRRADMMVIFWGMNGLKGLVFEGLST